MDHSTAEHTTEGAAPSKCRQGDGHDACPLCNSAAFHAIHRRPEYGYDWQLMRCRNCGLFFTDPLPSEEFLDWCYANTYHSSLRTPGATERAFGRKYARYAEWIGRHVRCGRALDVGCATGLLVKLLREKGFDAEGIELDRETAGWGSQHYGIPIHIGAMEQAPFPDASFDVITLTDVLEHARHPREFLSHVRRLLKPGGFVLVTFPDIRSVESRYLYCLSKTLGRPWLWRACHLPKHTWEFTKRTAVRTFAEGGFHVRGFRRSQREYQRTPDWRFDLLATPIRLLGVPGVRRIVGTQMEFMLGRQA